MLRRLCLRRSRLTKEGKAMRQRILGSHTPPCHRRMGITTKREREGGPNFV